MYFNEDYTAGRTWCELEEMCEKLRYVDCANFASWSGTVKNLKQDGSSKPGNALCRYEKVKNMTCLLCFTALIIRFAYKMMHKLV